MEKQSKEGICVAIRMRPLNDREVSSGQEKIFSCATPTNSISQLKDNAPIEGQTYYYDKVFDGSSATQEIYTSVAKDIVKNVVFGINGTIFAYGQTSSGKTHTMLGSSGERGVLELAAEDIFRHIADTPNRDFLLRVSFVEIYNEAIRDLLSDSLDASVAIREDPRKGVYCEANEIVITDYESIIKSLKKGISKRAVESTAMNDTSSRSHTIFKLVIESKESARDGGEPDGAILVASLNLVDLAGSESVRHTGAIGQRAKEGGKINQSLLSLSRVIHALSQPGAHVSFRDSKLTRLLQPSLCGNAKMSVICCITPAERYLEETRSTLQFASRAKLVSTHATVNEVLDDSAKLKRLQKELNELRERQSSAHVGGMSDEELLRLENEKNDLLGKLQSLQREKEQQQTQLDRLRQILVGGNATSRRMSINSRDIHSGFDATGLAMDTEESAESLKRHRKKHRDTWCPGPAKSFSAFSSMDVIPSASGRAYKRSFSGMNDMGADDIDSEVNLSTSSAGTGSTETSRLSTDNTHALLEEAQSKIKMLEEELSRARASALPSSQTMANAENKEQIAEYTSELEDELRKKTEEIDALVTERDQIFQQLEIEMGANAEHESEMQSQIESLTNENKELQAKLEMLAASGSAEPIATAESNCSKIEGFSTLIESLKEELRNQQEEASIMRDGYNVKCTTISQLEEQLAEVHECNEANASHVDKANEEIMRLMEKLANTEAQLVQAKTAVPLTAENIDNDDEIEMHPSDISEQHGEDDADVTIVEPEKDAELPAPSNDNTEQLEQYQKEISDLKDHVSLLEEDLRVSSQFTDMLLAQMEEVKTSKSEIEQELARVEGELLRSSMSAKPVASETGTTMEASADGSSMDTECAHQIVIDEEGECNNTVPVISDASTSEEIEEEATHCEESFDEDKTALLLIVSELEAKLESSNVQLAEMQAAKEQLQVVYNELEMEHNSLQTLHATLENEMHLLQTHADSTSSTIADLQDEIKSMEGKIEELSSSLTATSSREELLAEKCLDVENQLSASNEQLNTVKSQLDETVAVLASAQGKNSELQNELQVVRSEQAAAADATRTEMEMHVSKCQLLEINLNESQNIVSGLEQKLAVSQQTNEQLQQSLSITANNAAVAAQSQAESLAAANQSVDNLKQQIQQMQHQHLLSSNTMGLAQVDIEANKRDMDKTVQQVAVELGKKEAEISRLMGLVASLTERTEVAEKALISYQTTELKGIGDEESMRKKLNQLQTTVDLLKGEREALQKKVAEQEKDFRGRHGELVAGNEKLEAQLAALQTANNKLDSVQMENSRLMTSMKHVEAKMQDLKNERDELNSNLTNACHKIAELEEQCSQLQEKVDVHTGSNLESLHQKIEKMDAKQVESQETIQQLNGTVSELTMRLKKSKEEISMLQQELTRGDTTTVEQLNHTMSLLKEKQDELLAVTNERDELVTEVEKALQQVTELTEALIESDSVNAAATAAAVAAATANANSTPESEEKIHELTEQLENMHENIVEADKQIELMAGQLQQLEDNNVQMQTLDSEQKSEIAALRGEVNSLTQELEETVVQLDEMSRKIASMSEDASASTPSEQLLDELNVLMEAKLDMESKLQLMVSENANLKETLRARELSSAEQQEMMLKAAELEMDSLKTHAKEVNGKYNKLVADLEEAVFQNGQMQKTIDSFQKTIAEKEDIIASVENEMFSMRQEMSSGISDLAELEEMQSKLQKALTDNDNMHHALKQTKSELQAANDHMRVNEDMLEALRKELAEMEETKDKRIAHLEKHKITKEHLEMITKLKEERKKHQEDSKIMKKQLVDLKKAYENLRDSAAASAAAGAGGRATRSASASGVGGSSASSSAIEIADLKSQLIEVNGQLESIQSINQTLKSKLKECSKQLQEYEAERNGVIEILVAQGIDVNGLTEESGFLKLDGESSSIMEVHDLVVVVQKLADKLTSVKASLASLSCKPSTSASSLQRVRELEESLDSARNEIEDLQSQRSSLEKRLEAMKVSSKSSREEVLKLTGDIETMARRVESLEEELSLAQSNNAKLQQQIHKQQHELKTSGESSAEYQVLAEENLELFNENKKLAREVSTYKIQAERAQSQLAKLNAASQSSESSVGSSVMDDDKLGLSKKRSFGTDLSTKLLQSENATKDSSLFSPATKLKKTGSESQASASKIQSALPEEAKKTRTKAVPVVSTATNAIGPTSDAAPEEGCAQS